jgi:FkbM family methyltransferase
MLRDRIERVMPARHLLHAKALKNYWRGEPEIRWLRKLVDPARGSLDIGAAEGIYTYFLGRLSLSVDAYEPNTEFYRLLRTAAPRNARLHNIALSDSDGEAILSVPIIGRRAMPWRGTLENVAPDRNWSRVIVQTKRLDEMGHSDIGFIKMDVEGHEASVLRGATELIRKCAPTLLIEIEQRHIECDIREVFALITDMGYSGFFLVGGILQELDRFDVQEHQLKQAHNFKSPNYINNFIFTTKRASRC